MFNSSKEKQRRKKSKAYRKWTVKEDEALMAFWQPSLSFVIWDVKENGTFKTGYTNRLEKELKCTLPESNLKASPHIESRLKLLKRQYAAIIDMKDADGMQWNRKEQTVTCCDDDVWDDWVKVYS